ncbi:MAG TPA: hypothetical protein PLR06_00075 [Cyclobacteriaceae bacterium]|nr:hypothetical protein [Cyclobacteriaceae bacterium]
MSEEEIQNKIENGWVGEGPDAKAYQRIFDVLKKEPDFQLPADFADSVIAKWQPAQITSSSREIFWIFIGVAAFTIVLGIAVVLTEFTLNFGALKFLSDHSGLMIFGIVFVLTLQWIDKRFVKRTSFN